ncbi:MAG: methyltransferase domain-containing protein, partial [Alphaproteobacteria bacterium]|nr:methyltransferase domain-containing protein [Alphaproteobacteria bacterium]
MRLAFSLAPLFALAACQSAQTTDDAAVPHSAFPNAERLSAPIESPRWSTEPARDKAHEADDVMAAVHVAPGMTVADIGAGEGYYTIHLAPKVGKKGRVVAEDIEKDYVATLADRIARDRLDNVSVKLGVPEDPMLPAHSFDRIFMIHMYHEIASP